MVQERESFIFFIAFWAMLPLLYICGYFGEQYSKKYTQYEQFKTPISQQIHTATSRHTQLAFLKAYPALPTNILDLKRLVPSKWKSHGFKDKKGNAKFYWDRKYLKGYRLRQTPLNRKIMFANLPNQLFVYIGWPLIFYQLTIQEVFLPAYMIIMALSAVLFITRVLTKHSGESYAYLTFSRCDGYVTYRDEDKELWKCHISQINAYAVSEGSNVKNETLGSLKLVPRAPIGAPREQAYMGEWASNDAHDAIELWLVILNFMDVSHALPFAIPLENSRNDDFTTQNYEAAGDLETLQRLRRLSDEKYISMLETHGGFDSLIVPELFVEQ